MDESSLDDAAARWALRSVEGLTPAQERELAEWLAARPGHRELFTEHRAAWDRFAPLARPQLAAGPCPPPRSPRQRAGKWLRLGLPLLAAAAALAFGLWVRFEAPSSSAIASAGPLLPAPCDQRTLPDGTLVELNRGADIAIDFSGVPRKVRLLRGEATFKVAKDPQRPFVVVTESLAAQALGTTFYVRSAKAETEVLVTEGIVRVDRGIAIPLGVETRDPAAHSTLSAGQQLVVTSSMVALPAAVALSPLEIELKLAWRPRLIDFDDAPLLEIAAAFNRHNPVRLVVPDPVLANRRMTTTFLSDNVQGFVRLLERNYAIKAARSPDGSVVLASQ